MEEVISTHSIVDGNTRDGPERSIIGYRMDQVLTLDTMCLTYLRAFFSRLSLPPIISPRRLSPISLVISRDLSPRPPRPPPLPIYHCPPPFTHIYICISYLSPVVVCPLDLLIQPLSWHCSTSDPYPCLILHMCFLPTENLE